KLKVKGQKGQQIRLFPAELITKEKRANQKATGKPYYFSYTLKGTGEEEWEPRFSYYGFRYIEINNGAPDSIGNKKMPAVVNLENLMATFTIRLSGGVLL